ncbi:MAG: polyphosphate polymerase domain-containing protein [Acutalibacteraceae bacterium]
MENKFRNELKYEISVGEYFMLRPRLRQIMKPDPHADKNGLYYVKSLYFDNCYDTALHEKLSGVNVRDKYRIRCYNDDYSLILLEKKSKRNNLCLKKSCVLSREECENLINCGIFPENPDNETLTEIRFGMNTRLMKPKTIVAYKREPYIFSAGNVRITFDSDIRTGLFCTDFFDGGNPLIPAQEAGKMILEIKYDEFLPDIIRTAVQSGIPRLQAFSKYAASRQYE